MTHTLLPHPSSVSGFPRLMTYDVYDYPIFAESYAGRLYTLHPTLDTFTMAAVHKQDS